MAQPHSIPCPDCGTPIHFTVELMIKGAEFTCSGCGARLGLSGDSVKQTQEAIDKFNALKVQHSSAEERKD